MRGVVIPSLWVEGGRRLEDRRISGRPEGGGGVGSQLSSGSGIASSRNWSVEGKMCISFIVFLQDGSRDALVSAVRWGGGGFGYVDRGSSQRLTM